MLQANLKALQQPDCLVPVGRVVQESLVPVDWFIRSLVRGGLFAGWHVFTDFTLVGHLKLIRSLEQAYDIFIIFKYKYLEYIIIFKHIIIVRPFDM